MAEFNLNEILEKNENFPLIEVVLSRSSNVLNDSSISYAVTKVSKQSEMERLCALKDILAIYKDYNLSLKVHTIHGYLLSKSPNWTVADSAVEKFKTYDKSDLFEVILLDSNCSEREYYGNAGHEVHFMRGIVLRYPEELNNQ